jgi:urea transporter
MPSTELTGLPVAKPVRLPVPLSAYETLIAFESTTVYVEPAIAVAVNPVGIPTTEIPLVVSVVVYPSGLVTMTENATGPAAGLVYVPSDTECEELV